MAALFAIGGRLGMRGSSLVKEEMLVAKAKARKSAPKPKNKPVAKSKAAVQPVKLKAKPTVKAKAVKTGPKAAAKAAPKAMPKAKPAPKKAAPRRAAAAPRAPESTGPKLPRYEELPVRPGAPAGAAWGVFGDSDEIGTINLLTPERVCAAVQSVQSGKVFALNLPITIPDPPLFTRGAHRHTVKIFPSPAEFVLDDYLDNFYPQASSQWDALAHVKHPMFGAYNGIPDEEITGRGGNRLGIDNLARRGIAGRGVLADIGRYHKRIGKEIDFLRPTTIPLEDLQETLAEQGTELRPGDILLIRIGWTEFYLGTSPEVREELARETIVPGIEGTARTAQWLWDNNIAAVASDSPALEPLPKGEGEDFLHFHLLAFFGMPIGEMWNLEALAEDCAADNRYEFFITSAPLHIPGGVGSPPNALAIK